MKSISPIDGRYKKKTKELKEYFSLSMVPRFGGGIGVTRFVRALKMEKIITAPELNVA